MVVCQVSLGSSHISATLELDQVLPAVERPLKVVGAEETSSGGKVL